MTTISHNINAVIADLNILSSTIKNRLQRNLITLLADIQADLMIASPVGDSGNFKSNWRIEEPEVSVTGLEGSVYNNTIYAEPLEIGSPKGGRPWGKAGARTTESDGRVWSSQAVGGVMVEIVSDSYIEAVIKSITDNILTGIS